MRNGSALVHHSCSYDRRLHPHPPRPWFRLWPRPLQPRLWLWPCPRKPWLRSRCFLKWPWRGHVLVRHGHGAGRSLGPVTVRPRARPSSLPLQGNSCPHIFLDEGVATNPSLESCFLPLCPGQEAPSWPCHHARCAPGSRGTDPMPMPMSTVMVTSAGREENRPRLERLGHLMPTCRMSIGLNLHDQKREEKMNKNKKKMNYKK